MTTKTSEQYIHDLQEKNRQQGGTGTVYAVAKMLNVGESRLSHYVTGKSTFDEEMCFKTAFSLGLNPAEVIANVNAERAKSPEKASFWEDVLKKVSGTAAVFMLAVVVLASSAPSTSATAGTQSAHASALSVYYVKYRVREKKPFFFLLGTGIRGPSFTRPASV